MLPSYRLYKYFSELVNDPNKYGTYLQQKMNKMSDAGGKYPCLNLNHWAYDEIKKKIKNPISNIHDTLIFPKACKIGGIINRESNENYHCLCYFYGKLNLWKGEKDLYECFKDYVFIQQSIQQNNIDDINAYIEYRDCGCFNISHNAYNTINKLKNKGKSSNKGENISSVSVSTGTNGVTNSTESDGVVEFSYLRYTAKGRRNI
ncbi:PIR Superfamily Protein [Plasmodium ovale wallikeri]|uniref:PIR Superfamily Protein n=1 Tax=Plasmodium ovale wallikeri TaxID=864142 RepID=A0A1A9ALE1_PLAOA|nr:PIR Superfamily Protein [Plasmodium ovale wallikeri]